MAEFILGRHAFVGGVEIGAMHHEGEEIEFAFGRGTQVFPNAPIEIYGRTQYRVVYDTDQQVFEVGFAIDHEMSGNAATGWTDAGNYLKIEIQQSYDLVTWNMGRFIPAPVPVVALGGGNYQYWSRCVVPIKWVETLIDFRASSTRYGKSITALEILGTDVSLPNFPYAMPDDAAQLQTDLRANGYPDSVVTVDTATPISAEGRNYTAGSAPVLYFIMSGANVTEVRPIAPSNPVISLPSYPYSMPSQRAALQADLRTAGYTGAVVRLHAGEWEIFVPDLAAPPTRNGTITISPGDPYPTWDFFGAYQGEQPANQISFAPENTRNPEGEPLEESHRQFARFKISAGTRFNPYHT